MKSIVSSSIVASLVALLLSPAAGQAQPTCPEGKTATGACVNPALADAARQNALIFSQSKISQTHYPILAVDDAKYRYPNGLIPDQLKPSGAGTPVPPPSP